LNTSSELSVPSAQREYQATLEQLFEKIGLFSPDIMLPASAATELRDRLTPKVF